MIAMGRRVLSARIGRFALIGVFGAIMNLVIMTALVAFGTDYVAAGILANETTIVSNFIMQEKLVFGQGVERRSSLARRFIHSFGFNTVEGMVRVPAVWCMVELTHMAAPLAQGIGLVAAFLLRYIYHAKLVYAPLAVTTTQLVDEAPVGAAPSEPLA